jgi:hypothetical protein
LRCLSGCFESFWKIEKFCRLIFTCQPADPKNIMHWYRLFLSKLSEHWCWCSGCSLGFWAWLCQFHPLVRLVLLPIFHFIHLATLNYFMNKIFSALYWFPRNKKHLVFSVWDSDSLAWQNIGRIDSGWLESVRLGQAFDIRAQAPLLLQTSPATG